MKTTSRQLCLLAALACLGPLTRATFAQTATGAAEKSLPTPAAVAPASTPAVAQPPAAPAPVAAAPQAPAAPAASPAPKSPAGDVTSASESAPAPAAPSAAAASAATSPATAAPAAGPAAEPALRRIDQAGASAAASAAAPAVTSHESRSRRSRGDNSRVVILGNAYLPKGQTADSVVAVFGNSTSDGEVGDSVVSVFGNTRATGRVGDSVVAVFGNVYVNARVHDVVAVLGNVELGPKAEVTGDVVSVAGVVKRDPGAVVHGNTPMVGLPNLGLNAEWLHAYVQQCALKFRPLGFGPELGWAWVVAAGFLLFYILLALLFRGGLERTVSVLETRPGGSVLAAILTLLLLPIVFILLVITVVGIAAVPFLAVALLCASLFGKAVMLAWIGRRITRFFGEGPMAHPAMAVLIGGIIVTALYLVPGVGFVVYKTLGVLGLGVVVYALLLASKRPKPAASPAPAAAVVPPAAEGFAFAAAGGAGVATAVAAEPAAVTAVVPPIATAAWPRAGFWIRTAALLLDVLLVALVIGVGAGMLPHFLHVHGGPGILIVLAAYGAVLWKLKGTTIGGIICGLKVVRLDNRPIDWATAVVRALACFISLVALGLGFIWVAIDDEKQGWHDKIAGTTVVHARGAVSLV